MMNDAVIIQNDRSRINFLSTHDAHPLQSFRCILYSFSLFIHYDTIENTLLLLCSLYKTLVTLNRVSTFT